MAQGGADCLKPALSLIPSKKAFRLSRGKLVFPIADGGPRPAGVAANRPRKKAPKARGVVLGQSRLYANICKKFADSELFS